MGRSAVKYLILAAVAIGALAITPPIPQPLAYHDFFDKSACFGIPHCQDTLSNVPFIVVGAAGVWFLLSGRATGQFVDSRETIPYVAFFLGVALTGVGSGYYHLAPDNPRLAWDRAGMALAFASWFSAVIAERASPAWGLRLLLPLSVASVGAVGYWIATETAGRGDLRPYLLVQLVPYLLIPVVLWRHPARYTHAGATVAVMALYAAALALDRFDRPVAEAIGFVSGHTLKHLVGALAAAVVLWAIARRRAL